MNNLALKRIQQMKPYTPPLAGRVGSGAMLLDFNERTSPPSQKVKEALEEWLRGGRLQAYPEYFDLEKRIAEYAEINPDQILVTNGSDQGIDLVFRTFVDSGDTVIIPGPSFAMFEQVAQVIGARIISPLFRKSDLSFPFEEVLEIVDETTKLIVVCNPNSPTGTLLDTEKVAELARRVPQAIVYVDEAYFEFAKVTAASLIKQYPNIVVTRTFSKAFGLAGLRIGYVIAAQENIKEMQKVRGPYDVNTPAVYAAQAALEDKGDMEKYVQEVMDIAKPMVEQFFASQGVTYWPSAGNFILFCPDNPEQVLEALKGAGILVRPQNKPGIEGALRVSVGTAEEMKKFIDVYEKQILASSSKKPQPYAFLDRDGTLIYEPQDTYQIDSLEKLKILGGVIEGLQRLIKKGYKLILVSNQDGLGTASFPRRDFEAPQEKMLQIFRDSGVEFEEIFICPHKPEDNCSCRKPKTGLLEKFFKDNPVDKQQSFVCGDRESDRQLAANLGLKFFRMETNGDFSGAIDSLLKMYAK